LSISETKKTSWSPSSNIWSDPRTQRRNDGHFKHIHEIPLDVKVEKAFNDRKGKQVIAQHGIPLKNAQTQESLRLRAKKKVNVVSEACDFRRKGRKYFVCSGLNIGKPCVQEPGLQCRRRLEEEGSFQRDVRAKADFRVEYIHIQRGKQKAFEQAFDREAAYRRKTPERRNHELMSSMLNYKFAKFPEDVPEYKGQKLTGKVNRVDPELLKSRAEETRRSKSYYGKQCSIA
jgi:hypothetical protein